MPTETQFNQLTGELVKRLRQSMGGLAAASRGFDDGSQLVLGHRPGIAPKRATLLLDACGMLRLEKIGASNALEPPTAPSSSEPGRCGAVSRCPTSGTPTGRAPGTTR